MTILHYYVSFRAEREIFLPYDNWVHFYLNHYGRLRINARTRSSDSGNSFTSTPNEDSA